MMFHRLCLLALCGFCITTATCANRSTFPFYHSVPPPPPGPGRLCAFRDGHGRDSEGARVVLNLVTPVEVSALREVESGIGLVIRDMPMNVSDLIERLPP